MHMITYKFNSNCFNNNNFEFAFEKRTTTTTNDNLHRNSHQFSSVHATNANASCPPKFKKKLLTFLDLELDFVTLVDKNP